MFNSLFKKNKNDSPKKPETDPVCGMRASDGITLMYRDKLYAFCSDHCKKEFGEHPGLYSTH